MIRNCIILIIIFGTNLAAEVEYPRLFIGAEKGKVAEFDIIGYTVSKFSSVFSSQISKISQKS